jgi:hypothetical protein
MATPPLAGDAGEVTSARHPDGLGAARVMARAHLPFTLIPAGGNFLPDAG